jgi:hypothetical protein
MRIRTIKPEFWQHPVMSRLPYDTRILALGLLNLADDEGYFSADTDYIRGAVLFREDSSNVRRMLDELSRSGWITLCGAPERPIGRVVNFRKHQRVDRPQPSRLKQYALDESSTNDRRPLDDESTQEQGTGKGKDTPIVPASGDESDEGNVQDKSHAALPDTAAQNRALARAKAIFRMRPGTLLDRSQHRAWATAAPSVTATDPAEWLQLEAYYAADIPARDDIRRRDLATLLNNWSGELTRARRWSEHTGWQPENAEKKEKGAPPDDLWREVLRALYPDSDPHVYATWAMVPDSLRAEILTAIQLAEKEAA